MGDVGDYWREHKEHERRMDSLYERLGRPCAACVPDTERLLLPGQKCSSCGTKDPRKRNRRKKKGKSRAV